MFTEIETQQIVNATMCLGNAADANSLWKYVKGEGMIEKSLTLTAIAAEIKRKKGTVTLNDIQLKIMR